MVPDTSLRLDYEPVYSIGLEVEPGSPLFENPAYITMPSNYFLWVCHRECLGRFLCDRELRQVGPAAPESRYINYSFFVHDLSLIKVETAGLTPRSGSLRWVSRNLRSRV